MRRAKAAQGRTEKGFNQKDSDKYTAEAQKAGINVQVVSEVSDIVSYINDSTPGDLDVGYAGSGQNSDPSNLKSDAFKSGEWVNVVGGCRTAIDDKILGITIEKSVIKQFTDILDKNQQYTVLM